MAANALTGHIEARSISFRYSPLAPLVVNDVSLTIHAGQRVAIVGRSGSGKSTLAHLLLGLYEPDSGQVLYDGSDLAALEAHSVRQQIGIVTQSAYVFGSTIRENIALVEPGSRLEDVERAARLACIHDDIVRMPMGYETVLADGGASLSGGQRQRVGIARALLRLPRIVLMDEATSALDALTERQVYRNLDDLKDCTIIVIAHRLNTIAGADLILVMDGGKLVETGTHTDLMVRRGVYCTLVQDQASAAIMG